jgi:hypothetical protein
MVEGIGMIAHFCVEMTKQDKLIPVQGNRRAIRISMQVASCKNMG